MDNPDLDIAVGSSAIEQPPTARPPKTRQNPPIWLSRPTDPLRINIVTAFCTCDIEAPKPSYIPRLPRWTGKPEDLTEVMCNDDSVSRLRPVDPGVGN